ncbi:hypothetical protein J6590_103001, partial [Homalodisca vitripennis]
LSKADFKVVFQESAIPFLILSCRSLWATGLCEDLITKSSVRNPKSNAQDNSAIGSPSQWRLDMKCNKVISSSISRSQTQSPAPKTTRQSDLSCRLDKKCNKVISSSISLSQTQSPAPKTTRQSDLSFDISNLYSKSSAQDNSAIGSLSQCRLDKKCNKVISSSISLSQTQSPAPKTTRQSDLSFDISTLYSKSSAQDNSAIGSPSQWRLDKKCNKVISSSISLSQTQSPAPKTTRQSDLTVSAD